MTERRFVHAARWLLGLAFLGFGLDGFLHFIPLPPARPPAERFIGALIATGYFFQMVKLFELGGALLLLANRFVPLALVMLAPLLLAISSIHVFLNPEGIPLMAILLALHLFLVRAHWPAFRPVLNART